jgi:penicillin-insensitive murein endopeptidase
VRFYNPIAQESARRCYDALVAAKKLRPLTTYVRHRAKKGDTLGKLAKKYGVSPAAIKAANGIRRTLIRERAEYRIPVRAGAPRPPPAPLRFPSRRLPPDGVGQSSPDGASRAEALDGLSRQ